jgi:hypothetical protein
MMEEDSSGACIVKITIAMSKNLRRMNDKFLSALITKSVVSLKTEN